MGKNTRALRFIYFTLLLLHFGGCEQAMEDQPKYEVYEAAPAFPDRRAALVPPAYTQPRTASHCCGKTVFQTPPETLSNAPPDTISVDDLERGQERYAIYCAPCHGIDGEGHGPVVDRGFPAPPSYFIERLRSANPGYFYDVMTQGYGVMYSYADRISSADRWRIALYLKALQRRRAVTLSESAIQQWAPSLNSSSTPSPTPSSMSSANHASNKEEGTP